MGVRGLYTFLKPIRKTACPIGNETIAVDGNYILYRTYGDIEIFIEWINLHSSFANITFVFDGGAPAEKEKEFEKRRGDRLKAKERADAIQKVLEDSELDDDERKILEKRVGILEKAAWKPTKEVQKAWKERFDLLGIKWILVKGEEADRTLGKLCADVVISGDMDMFLLGVEKVWIINDFKSGNIVELRRKSILYFLGMSSAQFRDFCILLGVDERGDIPCADFIHAYHWIRRYGSLEELRRVHPEFWKGFDDWGRVERLMELYPVDLLK